MLWCNQKAELGNAFWLCGGKERSEGGAMHETWTVCTVQGVIKLFFPWQQRLHLSCSLGRSCGATQPPEEGGQLEKAYSGCSRGKKKIHLSE